MTVSELYIGGVQMPTPAVEGVTIKSEKIWSADTGRTGSGKMVGTIIGVKATVSIKWAALSMSDIAKIEAAVSDPTKPFPELTFTDMAGNRVTKTVYFGTPSYTIYSYADGLRYVKDVSVEAIEQ